MKTKTPIAIDIGADWRAKSSVAAPKTYCGSQRPGSCGDESVCGRLNYGGGVYQCLSCQATDVLSAGQRLSDVGQKELLLSFVSRLARNLN